MRSEELR